MHGHIAQFQLMERQISEVNGNNESVFGRDRRRQLGQPAVAPQTGHYESRVAQGLKTDRFPAALAEKSSHTSAEGALVNLVRSAKVGHSRTNVLIDAMRE
jgi:hypothetical protein